ncbi:MAG: TatD family hydrolase [Olsenella sp.]|nr:TatD family hydrolase [Olsenella sp.]
MGAREAALPRGEGRTRGTGDPCDAAYARDTPDAHGGSPRLCDAHVHLDLMSNAADVVARAERDGVALFANTVEPAAYLAARREPWSFSPNVRLGLGLHPWWVADGRVGDEDLELLDSLRDVPYVGEVGLDFSDHHTDPASHDRQLAAFRRVARVAARSEAVVSIHSVDSVDACLDVLQEAGALDSADAGAAGTAGATGAADGVAGRCRCVLHWFSGSTPQLWRAIRAGCYFSVNERQVRTRRAKEQLKLVPADRLLLETDLPAHEGEPLLEEELEGSLERALVGLARIRSAGRAGAGPQVDPAFVEALRATCAHNSRRLLEL